MLKGHRAEINEMLTKNKLIKRTLNSLILKQELTKIGVYLQAVCLVFGNTVEF